MRIEELTFLRFIAATIVVIFHYGQNATGFSGALVSGSEMVTFFFVLSGFVMGIAYLKKDTPISVYLLARGARILPLYFVALAMVLVIEKNIDITALALNVTLLQSWISPYPLSLNFPSWSLSVEMFFYISFPFILCHIKKYGITSIQLGVFSFMFWFLTHIATTIILNYYYKGFPSFTHDIIFYFPPTHLCSFLFGLSGAVYIIENKEKNLNKFLDYFLLVSTICIIVLILNNEKSIVSFLGFKLAFGSSLLSPLFLLLIIFISLTKCSPIKLLSTYPLVLLGESSYSLYILQKPGYMIYSNYISKRLSLNETLDFCMFFTFLLALSILAFFLFEKPANRFLRYSLPTLVYKIANKSFHRTRFTRR